MSVYIKKNNFICSIGNPSKIFSFEKMAFSYVDNFLSINVFKQRFIKKVKIWFANSHQRKNLASLDTRMLADVGLTIDQARVEYNKHFWE